MRKGDKKRQQKALKRRSQRVQKSTDKSVGKSGYFRHAREYPIEGCWTFPKWRDNGLATVVVARRQPNHNIAFGTYLVDYYCLGVKNAYLNVDIPHSAFIGQYLPEILPDGIVEITPALAHELVYGSIDYAAQFGFKPHRDFRQAGLMLAAPGTHPPTGDIEFGYEGQPLFIAGPFDKVEATMKQLERTTGDGNYHFFVPMGDPEGELLEP